ncbi:MULTISPECIES: hypothetical protein [Salinibaculum]|uniref:hypothetical protein n=1 Tax=Salinibaculum TaxID=2732368 RepID=UPI0030D328C4
MLETAQSQATVHAQETAREAKTEVGRRAFELLEEYFPEQAQERRQQDRAAPFVVGFAVGFTLGVLVSR